MEYVVNIHVVNIYVQCEYFFLVSHLTYVGHVT